jgi:hypothetical protein
LIRQIGQLKFAHGRFRNHPTVSTIYINLDAIARTLEPCQVFLNQHQASLLQEGPNVHLGEPTDLSEQLKLDTQKLEVYVFLLEE